VKRILAFLFILLVLVFGLFFGLLNAEPVHVDYYFGSRDLPLSLVLVLMLVIGALAGAFAGLSIVLRTKREVYRLRREVRLAEKELTNLRSLPIKEPH
jgi:lipopolysaccharide assembly protein A